MSKLTTSVVYRKNDGIKILKKKNREVGRGRGKLPYESDDVRPQLQILRLLFT